MPHPSIQIRKRDGRVVAFELSRIRRAVTAAFCAEQGLDTAEALDELAQQTVDQISSAVEHDTASMAAPRCASKAVSCSTALLI